MLAPIRLQTRCGETIYAQAVEALQHRGGVPRILRECGCQPELLGRGGGANLERDRVRQGAPGKKDINGLCLLPRAADVGWSLRPMADLLNVKEAPAWSLQNALVLLAKHRPGRRCPGLPRRNFGGEALPDAVAGICSCPSLWPPVG
ncbi:unnamed protein product [Durusdinium trenchii]|uniref:Uncharacterized protein n=3 Tax=Durusdinium trenchii TaxID=1381693 RepID=A0ABP0R365_9DINO